MWASLLAVAAVIVVTYTRLPPASLYNTSEEGFDGGLGRALVFLNYPASLVAIPIAWLAADRLGTRRALWTAVVATALCGVTALPGVVDQHDLDAKPVNVLPALGLAIAFVLSWKAPWERVGRLPLDPVRIVVGAAVWLVALVWLASVAGFYFPGDVLLGEEIRRGGDGALAPAVHRGDHEGLDAALLATAALVLCRYRHRLALGVLLGIMLLYGLAVEWRDFWFEQVVKRDWTAWAPPQVLTPRLNLGWAAVVLGGFGVAVALRRLEGSRPRHEGPPEGRGPPGPPGGFRAQSSSSSSSHQPCFLVASTRTETRKPAPVPATEPRAAAV